MKKTVVFGGSGFLGSHVCDALAERGYGVIIADIKEPSYLKEGQQFYRCDITELDTVKSVVDDNVKFVYNFAGFADLNEAIHQPLRTIELNVVGNLNILEACRDKKVERFVYASSAYAFSNKGSFYGISKHTSEKLIEEYFERFALPFSIVRYGSLYGERADEHNYIYKQLKKALKDKRLVVTGDPDDIREYIHAKDAARLSVDIIEDKQYTNEHIVLTGFERLKRKELFRMIKEILNEDLEIEYASAAMQGHYNVTPYSFHPNLARKLIANPFIDMGQGLVHCLQYIHQEVEREKMPAYLNAESE